MLTLCEQMVQNEQVNACIVEHIALLLCFSVNVMQSETFSLFRVIMSTEYKYHFTTFLLELLEGDQSVDTAVGIMAGDSDSKKRTNYEYTYRLSCSSMSRDNKELLGYALDESQFANEQLPQDEIAKALEYSCDKLLAGAIYLIGVLFAMSSLPLG